MRQVAAGAALTVALAGIVGGVVIAQQPRERVELIQPASGVSTPVPVETSAPSASPSAVPTTTVAPADAAPLPRVNVTAPALVPAPGGANLSPKSASKDSTAKKVQSEPAPVSTEPPAPASEEPAPSEPAPPSEAPPTTTNAATSSPLPVPGLSRPPLIPAP